MPITSEEEPSSEARVGSSSGGSGEDAPPTRRIAVALGSSFLGYFAHAGFLVGMQERGIQPVAISGSSAGAIAGGLYAGGLRGEDLREFICSRKLLDSFADFGMTFRIPAVLLGLRNAGLLRAHRAVRLLRELVNGQQIEDLNDPIFLPAASDLTTGESLLLREGDLAQAIVASCAVPGLFRGQQFAGRILHDGGVADEAPIDQWLDDPMIDEIIVHRVLSTPDPKSTSAPKKSGFPLFRYPFAACHSLVGEEILRYRAELCEARGKSIHIVSSHHPRPRPFPPQKTAPFFDTGKATALALWDKSATNNTLE